jgi:hypothetical protein
MVTAYVPAVLGVPLIAPVEARDRPGGRDPELMDHL